MITQSHLSLLHLVLSLRQMTQSHLLDLSLRMIPSHPPLLRCALSPRQMIPSHRRLLRCALSHPHFLPADRILLPM